MRKDGNGTLHSQSDHYQPDSTSGMDADYTAAVATIQQMWQGFQERLQEQLATLEQAIAHLTTNSLDPNLRQHAQTIAHRLFGRIWHSTRSKACPSDRTCSKLLRRRVPQRKQHFARTLVHISSGGVPGVQQWGQNFRDCDAEII
ncbi:hypothetical protein [Scytonema sp. NUACC21]